MKLISQTTPAQVTRGLLYFAVFVVIAIAFITSFSSGASGAQTLGYAPEFRASLPLVCDVVAAVATFMHAIARDDKQMRRTATGFVLVPMLLSWGANAIDHVARAEPGPWSWTVAVVGLAGLCPVAVAALLYLSTKFREFEQRQAVKADVVKQRAARRAEPTAPKEPSPTAPVPPAVEESEPDEKKPSPAVGKRAAGLEFARENWPVTGGAIKLAVGCSKAEADRIRAMVKQEMEKAS